MKAAIIERLGERDLLLPSLIAEGLAANDRVKVRLSVLQAAAQHARNPRGARFELTEECRAAGIDPVTVESTVNEATLSSAEHITAPHLGALIASTWEDVATMIRAVKAGDETLGERAQSRLSGIRAAPLASSDDIELAQIATLTSIADSGGDSLHRLVMDLHKALNGLAAAHAEATLAGARVYGLLPEDTSAVEAFMRGVEATRKLKFGHPGLATTAARAGARLTIQNDIGETDAHIVVVAVLADTVTVTYTDVHLARAEFFTGLFRNFSVQWSGLERQSAKGLGEDSDFYLVTGRYTSDDSNDRNLFLETLGASLVFLIDWNKARKVLRQWVPKGDAVAVLDWAARHRFGHRAFLELGGAEFVAAAVRHATPARIGFGERLDSTLGRATAVDFLKSVLRIAAEALLQGTAPRLAQDRVEAELIRHLRRVNTQLLTIVIRQAGLAREIAADIAQFIGERQAMRTFDGAALASRARHIEEKADRIAVEARGEIARYAADLRIQSLVNQVEDGIDELEEAAFVASLAPSELSADLLEPLAKLCTAALGGAEAVAAGVAAAAELPEGHRVDAEDVLAAIGRLIEAEHAADAAERAVTGKILTGDFDLKTALLVLDLARALERASDRLASFGHLLREYMLADHSV